MYAAMWATVASSRTAATIATAMTSAAASDDFKMGTTMSGTPARAMLSPNSAKVATGPAIRCSGEPV